MTQTTGQPAHMCEQNLLAAIKVLGRDAKLLPLKTRLNSMRKTEGCPFGTLVQIDTSCANAVNAGYVRKTGVIYSLTDEGEIRLSELVSQSELVPA